MVLINNQQNYGEHFETARICLKKCINLILFMIQMFFGSHIIRWWRMLGGAYQHNGNMGQEKSPLFVQGGSACESDTQWVISDLSF